MTCRPRLFLSEVVLLVAVATPLALAEGVWYLWCLAAGAGLVGWWTVVRRRAPLLNRTAGAVFIIASFGLLLLEYLWLDVIPIIALAHFMILVCVCKLLQQQNYRDQAQVFVLCLLLLIVAAIVSGDIIFPLVLLVYLTVGFHAFLQFHAVMEQYRVRRHNQTVAAFWRGPQNGGDGLPRAGAITMTALASLASVIVGVGIFVLFPRVGGGMFGRLDTRAGGYALTGFGPSFNFEAVGPIQQSERKVMTVVVTWEGGPPPADADSEPYFRGAVFLRYFRELGSREPWEWRSAPGQTRTIIDLPLTSTFISDKVILVLQDERLSLEGTVMQQRYLLQPTDHAYLFNCYPPLEIRLPNFDEIRKNLDDQTLRVQRKSGSGMRYEVVSAVRGPDGRLPVAVQRALEAERELEPMPPVLLPDPALPREAELRALVARLDNEAGTAGDLTESADYEKFARTVVEFLQGPTFTYRLEGNIPGGREPIGYFLLTSRQGYCQHFAAAMALLCQYRGIPARIVTGYRGGEYNPIGNYYVVREKHAHSWVEVYIPGRDWVTYDPTPHGQNAAVLRHGWMMDLHRYLDYVQFQWANLVVAYDSGVREQLGTRFEQWLRRPGGSEQTLAGSVAGFLRELIWWRAELKLSHRLLYWVFAIMVALMVVLSGYVIISVLYILAARFRQEWRVWSGGRRRGEEEFYERFRRRMGHLGLHRRPQQTPAEFAAELAIRYPVLGNAPELVAAYYEVSFGRRHLSADQRSRIEGFLKNLAGVDPYRLKTAEAAGLPGQVSTP
ncbi:MAG: DUF3488 domain-containing transglutaminase family protein [Phycisphaerae bacterium]|nr:DUF3488 domain-containing transglutaminase family protein [Phycisphaerae bacterium]